MSLLEIKNDLYKKEETKEVSQRGVGDYVPVMEQQSPIAGKNAQDKWEEKKINIPERKKVFKIGMIALGAVILVALIIGGSIIYRKSLFSEGNTILSIDGMQDVKSGSLITYEIEYKNNNKARLKNATLRLIFPEELKPEENPNFKSEGTTTGTYFLGEVASKSTGKVVFNARAYTPRGANIYLKAELSYQPSSTSTIYVKKDQFSIGVSSSPITINIMAPQNIAGGDEVNYVINYKNTSQENIANVRVRAQYPDGFTYAQSDPKPLEGNNIWYVGNLAGGSEGKIIINGKLEGEQENIRVFKIEVGATEKGTFAMYNEDEARTKIVASPFAIAQTVNGLTSLNANAGDNLRFEIIYKNMGTIGLRDVIVTEYISSPVLDYTTLELDGGAYDSENKTITWKASDYPKLANLNPGEGGVISFSIKVKGIISVENSNDKNFVITSRAKIDSPDIPTPISMNKIISGNVMDIKLNSKLIMNTNGYYSDSVISNSGPVPPKVGEETTYTIHWKVGNVSNDVNEAKVEAVLPTIARMTGKIFPEGAPLTYNERTNSIVWDMGNVEAGVGILSAPKEVAFQVSIKPSVDLLGREVSLLESSVLSARDSFTGEVISVKSAPKTTNLPEDASISGSSFVTN